MGMNTAMVVDMKDMGIINMGTKDMKNMEIMVTKDMKATEVMKAMEIMVTKVMKATEVMKATAAMKGMVTTNMGTAVMIMAKMS